MKNNSLLICLIFLLSNNTKAQDYVSLPTDNSTWIVNHFSFFGGSHTIETEMFGDTIIGAKTYKKIFQNDPYLGNLENFEYVTALREDDKKVYLIYKNQTEELLLYDFTKEVGDSVTVVTDLGFSGFPTFTTAKIESIDSVLLIDGNYRKRYFFPASTYHPDEYWVEGIGSSIGLLSPLLSVSDNTFDLTCFSESGHLIYENNSQGDCATTSINSAFKNNPDCLIFPNPASDQITIINQNEYFGIKNILIIDLLGRIVLQKNNILTNQIKIDLFNFAEGLYLVKINFNNNKSLVKKISIIDNQ